MLNKIDFNLSENEKYGLYFALTLLACVLLYFYIISPLATDRKKIETQVLQVNTELAKLQTFAGQNQDYNALLNLQKAKLEDAKKKMPDKVSVPELIKEYTQVAEENDIVLESLTPQEAVKTKVGNAYAIPMELTLQGDYFHMVNFLQQIETGERFISIQGTKFGAKGDNGDLTMTANFLVYSLNGSDMQPANAPAPGKKEEKGKIGHEGEIEKNIKAANN